MSTNLPPSEKLGPTKILILRVLKKNGSQTIQQVSDEIRVGYTGTGRALRQLWDIGWVTVTYKCNKTFWRIRDEHQRSKE